MQQPLQITFRGMPPSEAMEAKIRKKAQKLEQFCDRIVGCRVVVEAQNKNHNKGNLYHLHIDLTVPDNELAVSRDSNKDHAHEDAYVAIRDAFEAMKRQLLSYNRRRKRQVKTHDAPPVGRVSEVHPWEGFGRIETDDGRDLYFHENSILGESLEGLDIGAEVRFAEEQGMEGPQASTVKIRRRQHALV